MAVQVNIKFAPEMASVSSSGRDTTTTQNVPVALGLGVPLSNTRTLTGFVVPALASPVGQVMRPVALTVNPVGPETSAKVSVLVGRSASVAVAVRDKETPA